MELTVAAIHVGPVAAEPLQAVERVDALAGRGLVGDRYFFADGARPGMALTLVEAGVVSGAGLASGGTRRQLTVDGTGLNDLVGRRFRVGDVECFGVELCEPCLHLAQMTRPGIIKELVHRAGINADIVSDGTISVGDPIVPL